MDEVVICWCKVRGVKRMVVSTTRSTWSLALWWRKCTHFKLTNSNTCFSTSCIRSNCYKCRPLLMVCSSEIRCIAKKATRNRPSLVVACWQCVLLNLYAYPMQCRWNQETGIVQCAHHMFGSCPLLCTLQGLIIQDLSAATVQFITKGQISRPELQKLIPSGVLTHIIIPKGY